MQTETCKEPQIIELEDVVSVIQGGKLKALSTSQSKLNMLRQLCAPLRQQRLISSNWQGRNTGPFQLQARDEEDGKRTDFDERPDDPHLPAFHKALHAGYKGSFYEWHKEHFGTFWCTGVAA